MRRINTELDKLDLTILKTLQENPKLRIRDLAEKLQVPKIHNILQIKAIRESRNN
jgi:DNA-binding Lrp family transcriptional regulator